VLDTKNANLSNTYSPSLKDLMRILKRDKHLNRDANKEIFVMME
jgi:hypothetical protein